MPVVRSAIIFADILCSLRHEPNLVNYIMTPLLLVLLTIRLNPAKTKAICPDHQNNIKFIPGFLLGLPLMELFFREYTSRTNFMYN